MTDKIEWLLHILTGEKWTPRFDSEGNCFMWLRVRNEMSLREPS